MIAGKINELRGLIYVLKSNKVACYYKNISYSLQWVSCKKFSILRKFKMKVRTVLYFHRRKDLRNNLSPYPKMLKGNLGLPIKKKKYGRSRIRPLFSASFPISPLNHLSLQRRIPHYSLHLQLNQF